MKKGLLLLVVIIAGAALFFSTKPPALTEELHIPASTGSSLKKIASETPLAPTDASLHLINAEHPYTAAPMNLTLLPYDLAENVRIQHDFYVEEIVLAPLQQLFAAALEDDVTNFVINSAHRSRSLQQELYDKYGHSRALQPGYSEHESGLSLDIGSTVGKMENVEEGSWLSTNAHRFGFIVRYPVDKVDVTGISFEPWHIRYIGLPHSVMMHDKKLAFEEYVQFLRDEQSYNIRVDGVRYFVQYTTNTTLKIPNAQAVSISETNEGGYIVTSTY